MGTTIIISSAKGGVGKTTVATNLGVALAQMNKKTILIDGSVTTPDVALHLGVPFHARTLNDLIKEDADLNEVIFEHESGLKIIPTSIHPESSLEWLDASKISSVVEGLKNEMDYVIIDSPAGLSKNTIDVIKSADSMIIVTNPDLVSVANAYKTISVGKKLGIDKYGVIVNRTRRFKNELSDNEIKHIIGNDIPIIGKIPEHHSVPVATAHSNSVLDKFPKSPVAKEFRKIAAQITGEKYRKEGFLRRLFGFLWK